MKVKLLEFIDESTNLTRFQYYKILELVPINGTLKRVSEKLQSKVIMVENLTEQNDYWVVRAYNIYISGVKEIRMMLDALRAHKVIATKKK